MTGADPNAQDTMSPAGSQQTVASMPSGSLTMEQLQQRLASMTEEERRELGDETTDEDDQVEEQEDANVDSAQQISHRDSLYHPQSAQLDAIATAALNSPNQATAPTTGTDQGEHEVMSPTGFQQTAAFTPRGNMTMAQLQRRLAAMTEEERRVLEKAEETTDDDEEEDKNVNSAQPLYPSDPLVTSTLELSLGLDGGSRILQTSQSELPPLLTCAHVEAPAQTGEVEEKPISGAEKPKNSKNVISVLANERVGDNKKKKQKSKEKGADAAAALAVVLSLLGQVVLDAILNPSEVIFLKHDNNNDGIDLPLSDTYGYCETIGDGDGSSCDALRTVYALSCAASMTLNLLALLCTISVVIGMTHWLDIAYSFFVFSIMALAVALGAALWIAFPPAAAIGGSVLLILFLIGSIYLVLPSVLMAVYLDDTTKPLYLKNTVPRSESTKLTGSGIIGRIGQSRQQPTILDGSTALHAAAHRGNVFDRVLKISVLIAAEVDLDAQTTDADGFTALMIAAHENRSKVVEKLIKAGADVNIEGKGQGRTALHYCALKNRPKIAETLLKAGADFSKTDALGLTAEELAEDRAVETHKVIKEFREKLLHDSLLAAVKWQNIDRVLALLKLGAPPNAEDSRGTALHWAANRGFVEGARLLIIKKAKIDVQNKFGRTPLMEACFSGSVEVAKLLLASGAKTDIKADVGETALLLATWRGHAEVVNVLLENEAEPTRQELDEAVKNEDKRVLNELLRTMRNKMNCPHMIHAAALAGSAIAVKFLLKLGNSIDSVDREGNTALILAAQEAEAVDVVRELLDHEKPANVFKTGSFGRTALHWSAEEGIRDAVELLLRAGADVTALDENGATPADLARARGFLGLARRIEQPLRRTSTTPVTPMSPKTVDYPPV